MSLLPCKDTNSRVDGSSAIFGFVLQLLNAKPENVERESEIVAQSGRSKAVTIATNMAGRGTDIILGGNPEYMARYAHACTHALCSLAEPEAL